MDHAATLKKEAKLMAPAKLAATLNTPISELRPAAVDRILVIEDDDALRKVLRRLYDAALNNLARLSMSAALASPITK
jgi:hypothetical protein